MKKIFFFIILIVAVINLNAQFTGTGGPGGGKVYSLFVLGSNLYAGTETGGVYVSSNNGSAWSQIINGMGPQLINCLTGVNNTLLAGTNSGLYMSVNNGANWIMVNYGASNGVTALALNGTDIYLGTSIGSVYKSVNNGNNWTLFTNSISTTPIYSILFANGAVYIASNTIAASSNNGMNWNIEGTGSSWVKVLYATGNIIRAGTSGGGKKNTTLLGGWVQDIPWINYVLGYASVGNYILAGMSTGIFWTSNNGATWHDPNSYYMPGIYVWSMAQNSEYVFAGTGSGVYRRPISEINGISIINSGIPEKFSLSQNYPNPFNPTTFFRFEVAKSSNIIVELYNSLGQRISTLINQKLEAGTYEYSFDGGSLSSGNYYYKLSSNDFSQTKKMILIK